MKDQRRATPVVWATVIVVTPIAALLVVGIVQRSASLEERIARAVAMNTVHREYAATLQQLAGAFVAGSRFEGRVNTATAPQSEDLSLFVVSPDTIGMGALRCNCGYVGNGLVLCDKAFLDTFARSMNY